MKKIERMKSLALGALLVLSMGSALAKPNIVLVMTDDQGYGDLACHGHPYVRTPHIDNLASEAVCLDDYHVAPTCSPTRSALLTGHWTNRTGVWHTINGRSMLRENEITLGQLLKDAGYETGMFGKWHLGDNFPYRPEDRGFTEVYRHGGGGVGQTPDVWDNAYFDGGYFHNGEIVNAEGFCTDVFFQQAHLFIKKNVQAKKPFFAYIATNAPHGPMHAPQSYVDMYQGKAASAFYGMITNIDDNVGKTRLLLNELGVADDTIFIFTTDNGTSSGSRIFNAGMRGAKGSEYDGGHRVPFFVHWPNGGMKDKRVVKTLTHAVDVVPTLTEICGAAIPAGLKFDGRSIWSLLKKGDHKDWADRYLVTDSQRVVDPVKWRKSSVMSQGWRLINGTELYNMTLDAGQQTNVAKDHPDRLANMRAFYEKWWAELEPTFSQTTEIQIGHPNHPRVSMTSHDWITGQSVPWNQGHIRNAKNVETFEGFWAVKVLKTDRYTFQLRRWPVESNTPINAALPAGKQVPGTSKAFRTNPGKAVAARTAVLNIDGKEVAQSTVQGNARQITFTTELKKGSHKLSPFFILENGNQMGAYYLVVEKVP